MSSFRRYSTPMLQITVTNYDDEIPRSYNVDLNVPLNNYVNNNDDDLRRFLSPYQNFSLDAFDLLGLTNKHQKIKSQNFKSSDHIETCAICLEDTDEIELKCSHIFHMDCLTQVEKNSCPMCRAPIY